MQALAASLRVSFALSGKEVLIKAVIFYYATSFLDLHLVLIYLATEFLICFAILLLLLDLLFFKKFYFEFVMI